MKPIALATDAKHPKLTDDDRLLLDQLEERGIRAEPAIWNDPSCKWSSYDAVVLRSCWDYHLQAERFLGWIADLEAAKISIFNSASLIRWNSNKTYLRDLEANGVAIVPTFWAEGNSPIGLDGKLLDLGWPKAVVKPRISATAYRTQLVTPENAAAAQPLFDDLRRGPGVMLQKFMESIASEGEWSVIFLGGVFSHAVLKKPKPGDFRVQNDFGGTEQLADPPAHVLASATRALQTVATTLYARVDGVVDEGTFRIMELELLEPALFLGSHTQAPDRLADAIAKALR
jgi:glutathione synthase/RimK-type ligase-like ATP-grasp enzyme